MHVMSFKNQTKRGSLLVPSTGEQRFMSLLRHRPSSRVKGLVMCKNYEVIERNLGGNRELCEESILRSRVSLAIVY